MSEAMPGIPESNWFRLRIEHMAEYIVCAATADGAWNRLKYHRLESPIQGLPDPETVLDCFLTDEQASPEEARSMGSLDQNGSVIVTRVYENHRRPMPIWLPEIIPQPEPVLPPRLFEPV